MSYDLTQVNKTVDQYWRETPQETQELGDTFWQRCKTRPAKTVNTKGEKWMVRTLYNESESGASFDGGAYATAGNSQFQNLYVPYRTVSTSCQLTQEALDNDDAKAKYHPLVGEMNSTKMKAFKNLNRHLLMGDGTGRIGVITAEESGSTVTCAPGTDFGNKGVQFINGGKVVQIYDATGATQRTQSSTIDKLTVSTSTLPNRSTGVVTFTSAAPSDTIATDIIVPEGMGGRGVNGLPYWVANSGSLFELSRATYPGLKSTMVDGSSGALLVLVESMFSTMAHYIEEDAALGTGGAGKHELFWSPTQREKYRRECIGLGLAMVGSDKIDAGYGHKEEINNLTCTMLKDHDNTKIHFLKMDDWYRVGNNAAAPFEPVSVDGNTVYNVRSSSGVATSTLAFTLRGYVNLACENVRNQGAIYSLPTSGLSTGNQ